jgi:hypothetical protein
MKVIVGYRAGPYTTRGLHRIESTVALGSRGSEWTACGTGLGRWRSCSDPTVTQPLTLTFTAAASAPSPDHDKRLLHAPAVCLLSPGH